MPDRVHRTAGRLQRAFSSRDRDGIVACLRDRRASSDVVDRAVESLGDDDSDVAVFTISDRTVDSYNSTIAPDGVDFSAFSRNPVVLFAHDQNALPVGRDIAHFASDEAVTGTTLFVPREIDDFGYRVGRMVRAGFLNAVSIGFDPTEFVDADRDAGASAFSPIDYRKWRLLEYSVLPVPSNPNALIQDRSGLSVADVRLTIDQMLERTASVADLDAAMAMHIGMSRVFLDSIRRSFGASKTTVVVEEKPSMSAAKKPAPKPVEMRENPPALNDPAEVEVQPDVTPAAEERSADEEERAPVIMQCPECGYKGEQADFTPAEGEDEESREGAPEDEAEAEDEEEMVRASDVQRMIAAAAFRAATKAREETLRDLGRLD